MSTSGDSAEEFVRLSLDTVEVFAKLSGGLVKNVAVMLYAMSKDKSKRTKGRTRLANMLKSSSSLSIFSIKKEDYNDFKKQAKKYGILYCALYNKSSKTGDGLVDLMIKEEDSGRVNRVVERYNITKVDVEKIEKVLDTPELAEDQTVKSNNTQRAEINKDIQTKNTSDDMVNILLKRKNIKEENENTNPSNLSGTEKNNPSELSSKANDKSNEGTKAEEKPSIREQIETIAKKKEEEKAKTKEEPQEIAKQTKPNETKHQQPKKIDKKRREKKNEFI